MDCEALDPGSMSGMTATEPGMTATEPGMTATGPGMTITKRSGMTISEIGTQQIPSAFRIGKRLSANV